MTRSVAASPWGHEDRALMLGLQAYRATLCPGCGNPKATAWHIDNEGHWEVAAEYTCQPCTVRSGHPSTYTVVIDTRDYAADPLHGDYTDHGAVAATVAGPSPAAKPPAAAETSLGG